MSRINFAPLASERPDLVRALVSLDRWMRSNRTASVIDPRRVAHADPQVNTRELAEAFNYLVDKNLLAGGYMVESPDGTLVEPTYSSPEKIPYKVKDAYNKRFDLAEGDIIYVLTYSSKK